MISIDIKTIPHSKQRYETVGDWWWQGDTLHLRVSKLEDWRMEMGIALHEMVEALLCKDRGITQKSIDEFDKKYESDRARGKYTLEQEPGHDPDAPYRKEHFFADVLERLFIKEFGISWPEYNTKVCEL